MKVWVVFFLVIFFCFFLFLVACPAFAYDQGSATIMPMFNTTCYIVLCCFSSSRWLLSSSHVCHRLPSMLGMSLSISMIISFRHGGLEEEDNFIFGTNLTMWVVHNKSQGDFKSFKLWGQRTNSPFRLKRSSQESNCSRRGEWKSCNVSGRCML
jgi:hypothetical protein